jgi:methionyl-tRNA synthetase
MICDMETDVREENKYLITSALPYANGPLHLGHLAGAYLPGDIYARYCRLKKRDTLYICGSDEHGVPIMLKARQENVSPQEIVDRYHFMNEKSFERFGMSFDHYGRTSLPIHYQTSQDFFRVLAKKKLFILKKEKQLYDPEANIFLADRFVRGTCPACGYQDAYGDQCEKCGVSLSPSDLKNPRSAITQAKPIQKETCHWYLPLSTFQKALENWIATHPEWRPNVKGQIYSWFKDGLKDRAVTRDLSWGIPIPEDVASQAGIEAAGKVLYVWFDAPIGYISATKEWAIKKGVPDLWKKYWLDKTTRLIHFIGKDNIVFHCLIFPAMLMNHGDFVIPENVPANEFLNIKGLKFSTSRGVALWVEDFLNKFPADSLRYALAKNMPETRDADFSWEEFQARHNNELADILGNFVNRTFTFVKNYFHGILPAVSELNELDQELLENLNKSKNEIGQQIDNFQFKEATRLFMDMVRFANKYFNDQAPWKSRKKNLTKCATTINLCIQTTYSIALLMNPLLPFTSAKIWKMLNLFGTPEASCWDNIGKLNLEAGHPINKPEILFSKIPDKIIAREMENMKKMSEKSEKKEENTEVISNISYDEFQKMALKTARVKGAEKIHGTDKLLKLVVEVGPEERQLVAGIAQHYTPEELIGKTIIIVANLTPSKIRGVESQGMLLAAQEKERLVLITTDKDSLSGLSVK